jgi:hypothetical protein
VCAIRRFAHTVIALHTSAPVAMHPCVPKRQGAGRWAPTTSTLKGTSARRWRLCGRAASLLCADGPRSEPFEARSPQLSPAAAAQSERLTRHREGGRRRPTARGSDPARHSRARPRRGACARRCCPAVLRARGVEQRGAPPRGTRRAPMSKATHEERVGASPTTRAGDEAPPG